MKFIKILMLIFVFLILINVTKADLVINPTTVDVSTNVNVEKQYVINITNTYDFDIYNIEFTDVSDVKFTNIQQLKSQESILTNFTVRTTNIYNIQNTTKVSFSYYTPIINPTTLFEINVTYYGFASSYLSAVQSSSIKFNNQRNEIATIIQSTYTPLYNLNIQPKSSATLTFSEIGEYNYRCNLGFDGFINISSVITQELTHNVEYDKTLILNIDSKYFTTTLELTIIDDTFNMSYLGSSDGLLKIKNTGNEKAFNTILSSNSNWITFDENNFDLNSGELNYVSFNILPKIYDANETDRNYDITIIASAQNADIINDDLDVFIQSASFITGNMSYEELKQELIRLRQLLVGLEFPEGQSQIIYRDNELGVNYTVSDVYAMKNDIAGIRTSYEALNNQLKVALDNYNVIRALYENMDSNISGIETTLNKEKQDSETNRTGLIIFIVFVVVSICIIGCSYVYYRNTRKKKMEEAEKR